jgi:Protein of unknown function (DUF3618)
MSEDDTKTAVEKTRATLEWTLDAIEDKLNVPKRASELKTRATAAYQKNPTPWIVGATGVAIAVIGVVAWAIFSRDDD